MALTTAILLTLFYALAAPLGMRVRRAEERVVARVLSALKPPHSEAELRRVLERGWISFSTSDLWLLLLLAALIGLFVEWWLGAVLPVAGLAGRWGLDRLDPYPSSPNWYRDRFRSALQSAERGADPETRRLIDDAIRILDDPVAEKVEG